MCDFGSFVPADGLPIYLQIVRYVERGVAAGTIADGEELPSRRVLSAQLGVNPNTVARAYYELEDEGVIRSIPKKGVFACAAEKRDPVKEEARSRLIVYREAGLSKEDALSLIEEVYRD